MNDHAWDWAWHRRGLTPTQRLVLLALAEQAAEDGATCLPPLRRLERMTGLSRRGVAKTLNALEAAGLIAREEGECEGATAYRLFLDRPGSGLDSHGNNLEGGSKHVSNPQRGGERGPRRRFAASAGPRHPGESTRAHGGNRGDLR